MNARKKVILPVLLMVFLLSGCAMRTVEDLYRVPRRSAASNHLQSAIDAAMSGMEYAAPISGENQQTVQMADLDGDGLKEYLLFTRDKSEKPLHILIFHQDGQEFRLMESIDSRGTAFDQVEYVELDGEAGLELVVGRQVSDQLLRSVSVYTFTHGAAEQLVMSNYSKFLTFDLNEDGRSELLVLHPGQTDEDNAVATLYGYADGTMERSREASLSGTMGAVKRITTGNLEDGIPAVFIATAVNENTIVTDILAMKEELLTNISFSNEAGASVRTARSYYVYADDLDKDGILELPAPMSMRPVAQSENETHQSLIRWFSLDLAGQEQTHLYTYHNFAGGWYLELREELAESVSVEQQGNTFRFYLWDGDTTNHVLSIFVLTEPEREELAITDNRFVLMRGEGILYAAKLESASAAWNFKEEELVDSFHLIRQDWKTGET